MEADSTFHREKAINYITNYLKSYSPQTLKQIQSLNDDSIRLVILQIVYQISKETLVAYIEDLLNKQD